jgi:uncharacterized membrane protein YraQ (UPF0718 family)/copper chaperone CopZ
MIRYFVDFWKEFYLLVSEMAPYLLFGFLFAGVLKAFVPTEGIVRFMGKKSFGSVANAALLGVPLPLCSCGVIPTAVSFFRNGATKGATTSFLISTPQTGVDSILATYAMLGLPFAIIRPVVAFLTGLAGGAVSHLLDKEQSSPVVMQAESKKRMERQTLFQRIRIMFRYGFGELVEDIVKWLIIGLLAAAFISMAVPDSFFSRYIGNPWIEMLIVLAASVPLYVCATGSIPLAAVLIMKGISPGAALVFLMAGPATNIATVMVVGNTMGRKALAIYLSTIISGALIAGFLVNNLMPASWFAHSHMAHHAHHAGGGIINLISAILLFAMIAFAIWNKWLKDKILPKKINTMTEVNNPLYTVISVGGMTCNHCKATVEKNLASIEGIDTVIADIQSGEVKISGSQVNIEKVTARVGELGYEFKGLVP